MAETVDGQELVPGESIVFGELTVPQMIKALDVAGDILDALKLPLEMHTHLLRLRLMQTYLEQHFYKGRAQLYYNITTEKWEEILGEDISMGADSADGS